MLRVLCAAAFVMAASCPASAKPKPAPKPKLLPTVRYVCEDGTRLGVTRTAPGVSPATATVRILGTDKELVLQDAAPAGSGHYASAGTVFVDGGATATFTQDGATALPCRLKR